MALTKTPPWLLAASVTTLVVTLLFMMALVVLSAFGKQVPNDSRFLIVIVLALGAGFGAAGLGGEITARGQVPIPGLQNHVVAISAAGGVALFVIVLLLRDSIVPAHGSIPDLSLKSVTAQETATEPPRMLVTASFDGLQSGPDARVLLSLCKDLECRQVLRTDRVDDPRQGSMIVFVAGSRDTLRAARLELEDVVTKERRTGSATSVTW